MRWHEVAAVDEAKGELGGAINALGRACVSLVAVPSLQADRQRLKEIETELLGFSVKYQGEIRVHRGYVLEKEKAANERDPGSQYGG